MQHFLAGRTSARPTGLHRRRGLAAALALVAALAGGTQPVQARADSPADSTPVGNTWVSAENALPGDAGWNVAPADYADADSLAGYATSSSVAQGDPITLRITNTASDSERVLAYRMGWYQGTGGRLVATSESIAAQQQPAARFTPVDDAGRTVNTVDAANWSDSVSLDTSSWPAGAYLLVLDNGTGKKAQVPVIVRSTSFSGRTVLVSAPTTWQAYNRWGGYSAYYGLVPGGNGSLSGNDRSRIVSFQRPLDQNGGVDHFMVMERAGIAEAERLGVDLAYTTTIDLARGDASAYAGARAMVGLGHDEYWNNQQATTLGRLRDAGTNLVFAGGNAYWWRVRYLAGQQGMEIWKSATEDPVKTAGQQTVNYGDSDALPMLGAHYSCYAVNAPLVVTDPTSFLLRGTGATAGSSYPGLLREEVDSASMTAWTPKNLSIAAHSPYHCNSNNRERQADLTYFTVASGAGVVDLSSMGFVMAMDPVHYDRHPFDPDVVAFATQVFDNAVLESSIGPLGQRHTPLANAAKVLPAAPAPPPVTNPDDPADGTPTTSTAAGTRGSGVPGDLDGNKLADVLAVRSTDGAQFLYRTAAGPRLTTGIQVGQGWGSMTWMGKVPDLDGNGHGELAARRKDGTLWLYPGLGDGRWGIPTKLGQGWSSMTSLTVSPDLSGDGRPDLLARRSDGLLLRYSFSTLTASLRGMTRVGTSWNPMRFIVAVDDLSGDHKADVLGVRSDGNLFLYTARGNGLALVRQVGRGWQGFSQVFVPGDLTGDGRMDLVGLRTDGNLYAYANRGTSWAPARQIGSRWGAIRLIA